jgi:hypothetical protein
MIWEMTYCMRNTKTWKNESTMKSTFYQFCNEDTGFHKDL